MYIIIVNILILIFLVLIFLNREKIRVEYLLDENSKEKFFLLQVKKLKANLIKNNEYNLSDISKGIKEAKEKFNSLPFYRPDKKYSYERIYLILSYIKEYELESK